MNRLTLYVFPTSQYCLTLSSNTMKYTPIAFTLFSAVAAAASTTSSGTGDDRDIIIRNLVHKVATLSAKVEAQEAWRTELASSLKHVKAAGIAPQDKTSVRRNLRLEDEAAVEPLHYDSVLGDILHELVAEVEKIKEGMEDMVGEDTGGLKSLYIEENLDAGEVVTVYEAGPIKVEASCGGTGEGGICNEDGEVCLVLTLFDANEQLQVFGQLNSDGGLDDPPIVDNVLPANTEYKGEMWDVSSSGNEIDDGGVWAGGYYLGFDGDTFLGLRRSGGLQVIGGNCQIAGVFNVVVPEDEE